MGESGQSAGEPRKLGKYVILRKLGAGGMTAVYLAEDALLGRKVAIKVLPRAIASEELIKRVYQEARLTASLHHPNIVAVHDIGEQDGLHYVALDYVEGKDLLRLATEGNQAPPLVLLKILAAVAGALQHVHDNQVIHRDIKPENIVVGPTGEPVLIDFGLAMPPSGDPLQQEGMVIGTPHYMSPEQATAKELSPRSDIYSFGATMYHVFAGRTVYDGKTAREIMEKTIAPDPVDLSPLEGKAPEFVISIIGRCLRKDPDERYRSADELRRALEAAVDHLEAAEGDTVDIAPPRLGQTLLLHVEYREADLPGAYREYEVGERLGGGTFGEVFRAKEKLSGKDVALKVLRREWVARQEAVARFRREAALLSRLAHPNIVRVYNFGRYGASFFMAMELLSGRTLSDAMAERGRMAVGEAVRHADAILSGLAALHEEGIVHRDLKPENVAVEADRIVLFDLNTAHAADVHKLTMTGELLGSPRYMSPEQASGAGVTGASDVYSTGVMLYEMLTGKLPHEAETSLHLMSLKAHEPPTPVTAHRSDLPGALVAALDRMLRRNPDDRPSAAEAREALAAATA